jgi:hypothetical protein
MKIIFKMFKTPNNPSSTSKPDSKQEFKLFLGCIPGSANEEDILPVLLSIAKIKYL